MSRHLTRRVKEYLYDNVAVVTDLQTFKILVQPVIARL